MSTTHQLSTPSFKNGLLEYRAAFDLIALPAWMSYLSVKQQKNIGKGRHVFVVPGFGASDSSMKPLRYFLERHGFKAMGWGLGVNRAGLDKDYDTHTMEWELPPPTPHNGEFGVPHLCDLMAERVKEFYEQTGKQVSLVGWSLGGVVAREVARDLPEMVDHVVTLGTPLTGGPKYTAAAPILAKKGLDLDWIEAGVEERKKKPIQCKLSAIVSKTDGVVDWSASVLPEDQQTRYIEVNVSHLGMGFNRQTMSLVLKELQQD